MSSGIIRPTARPPDRPTARPPDRPTARPPDRSGGRLPCRRLPAAGLHSGQYCRTGCTPATRAVRVATWVLLPHIARFLYRTDENLLDRRLMMSRSDESLASHAPQPIRSGRDEAAAGRSLRQSDQRLSGVLRSDGRPDRSWQAYPSRQSKRAPRARERAGQDAPMPASRGACGSSSVALPAKASLQALKRLQSPIRRAGAVTARRRRQMDDQCQ